MKDATFFKLQMKLSSLLYEILYRYRSFTVLKIMSTSNYISRYYYILLPNAFYRNQYVRLLVLIFSFESQY